MNGKNVLYAVMIGMGLILNNTVAGEGGIKSLLSLETHSIQPTSSINKQIELLQDFTKELKTQLAEDTLIIQKLSSELKTVKNQVKIATADQTEFLNKKLNLINRTYQSSTEIVQTERQTITILEEHEKILREYQIDPHFESLKQFTKASPDFEDLQKSIRRLFSHKNRLDELEKNQKDLQSDREKRKKALDIITKEYEIKKLKHQTFNQENQSEKSPAQLSLNQQGELFDAELRHISYKKKLFETQLTEINFASALLDTKLMLMQKQVALLETEYTQVKRSVVIDTEYVKKAEDTLEKNRKKSFAMRDQINENIRRLLPLREDFKKKIEKTLNQFDLSVNDSAAIKLWAREVESISTMNDWRSSALLGSLHAQAEVVESHIKLLEAQILKAKIDFRYEEREVEILRSWHRMTQKNLRFNIDKDIEKEVKTYENERLQLKSNLIELYEKRDSIIDLLYKLNVTRDKIKLFSNALTMQKNILFVDQLQNYQEISKNFIKADDELRKRIDFIGKLMEVYANSIAKVRDGIKKIEDINHELKSKSFWMRSTQSIEWENIKNFLPDIERFIYDVKKMGLQYIYHVRAASLINSFLGYIQVPYLFFLLIIRLLIIIVFYILLKTYLPDLRNYLTHQESRFRFFTRLKSFAAITTDFFVHHLPYLYAWLVMLCAVKIGLIHQYIAIWFYLFSIVYLLFIAHSFFGLFFMINKNRGYIFIGPHFHNRFELVVPYFVYATIVIEFFRQAFILGNYYGSPAPNILFAINIILLQITLISLISKELILGAFVWRNTPFSEWIEERIEKYYYLFLLIFIAIVIMINPYVGYGRQVFYVLSRMTATFLLIPLFSWIHNRIKRTSSDFFFYYADGSAVKERFSSGKSWYGFFIIVSFICIVLLGLIIIARIWGHALALHDINRWINYTLYNPGIDEITGKPIQVSIVSIVKIFAYLLGGIILAHIANQFVLRRIFDPLLIGSGVQNTILTLSRYIFILVALLIGLQSAGLDAIATKIAVLIGIIGFAIKEPIADFFSYFIILVQRPIKIGDLIQVDVTPEVFGVVRHITPRSTIVRHKNSLTLVVPNSAIITHVIRNWHYSRSFGAFRDITITVPYSTDPQKIRELMFEVLDNNINILKNPKPIVWLVNFSDFGFQFTIRGFLSADKVIELFDIESDVRLAIIKRLRQEGIEIAIPTHYIKMHNTNLNHSEDNIVTIEK